MDSVVKHGATLDNLVGMFSNVVLRAWSDSPSIDERVLESEPSRQSNAMSCLQIGSKYTK